MQLIQEQLQKKNQGLIDLYRDKSKKHAQTTNLYNLLKSRAMRSQIQTAASDSVNHTLRSLGASKPMTDKEADQQRPFTSLGTLTQSSQYSGYPIGQNSMEWLRRHQSSGSGNSVNDASLDISARPPLDPHPGVVAPFFHSSE